MNTQDNLKQVLAGAQRVEIFSKRVGSRFDMEIHLHGNAKGQVLQLNDVSDAELCAMLSAMKMAGEKLGVKVDYYSRTTPIRSYGSKGS